MSTRPIVVGADGSQESLRAVEWAAREAWRRGSPLRIVSATATPPRMRAHDAQGRAWVGEEGRAWVGEEGRAWVGEDNVLRGFAGRVLGAAVTRAEEVAPGVLIDTDLLSGPPALAVPQAGCGASMLVVGARGLSGLAAMVLGSVSGHAASGSPCPVVVVREETMAIHREIAVGIRDPRSPSQALAFAFEEAALRDAGLVAVHALAGPADTGDSTAEAAAELAATLEPWRGKYPAVRVRQDVVNGHPAAALSGYSARADLVVAGRHDRPATTAHAIGSIQSTLLHHAHGPIAIVPADSWYRVVLSDGR